MKRILLCLLISIALPSGAQGITLPQVIVTQLASAPISSADVRVLALVLQEGNATSPPQSIASVQRVVFTDSNSVAAFWRENSEGKFNIVGQVWPTVLVTTKVGLCGGSAQIEARALAKAQGADLTQYDKFMVVHTRQSGCSQGTGGGDSITMNGGIDRANVAHEFGHAFGLGEAASVSCSIGLWSSCSHVVYNDGFDVMSGKSQVLHSSAPDKQHLGVLDATRWHEHQIGTTATYSIKPLESTSGVVAVRIRKPGQVERPNCSTSTSYAGECLWIEYRQKIGFDAAAPLTRTPFFTGARITATGGYPVCPYYEHCLVQVKTGIWSSYPPYVLLPGETYIDKRFGVAIKVLSLSATEMQIAIAPVGAELPPTTQPPPEPTPTPTPAPAPGESPSGTTMPPEKKIIDASGKLWELASDGRLFCATMRVADSVTTVKYVGGVIYAFRTGSWGDKWYRWAGSGWLATTAP